MNVKRIAIFASGSGTNAQNIIHYFSDNEAIEVDSLWSNKPKAYALSRAEANGVKTFVFNREQFYETEQIAQKLKERDIDLVVLAGFLWLVPDNLVENFRIINIHPALLPKYGGKGMYGMKVHQSVVDNKESETGISIHFVNKKYDEGELIFQAKCPVLQTDSPEEVATKVHELEYKHFPVVIEQILLPEGK
ncbi:formyltetrahydrofolate-dependent phosphoribosylglycinamide formyltransferase [Mariniphaga anaerophila]|uniref:Phosphoribosylglycinamide formyltransferase n=1 Tax=Mariniphaga anaerophila TaxID=1484053 RepID=A0A1M5BBP7_9BACT|nr:phosphoribosylglycinamide formyltransferase [Mariniphaga anaerophila]SHF39880.1 formyltetrahydrofolate-dependent phosphoribosylglycinamide formyltransferase [Mariniphaga anaerophila]